MVVPKPHCSTSSANSMQSPSLLQHRLLFPQHQICVIVTLSRVKSICSKLCAQTHRQQLKAAAASFDGFLSGCSSRANRLKDARAASRLQPRGSCSTAAGSSPRAAAPSTCCAALSADMCADPMSSVRDRNGRRQGTPSLFQHSKGVIYRLEVKA